MTIIIFFIVLLVTVLVHEWGHFYAARKSGMTVEEFGFGIPPRLYAWKSRETTYSINALPIGGFVKIAGENGIDGTVPLEQQFESKPWYKKAIVLAAGVICNILLAVLLFTIAYTFGMPARVEGGVPTIVSVVSGSPAAKAGLAAGDTVQSIGVMVGGDGFVAINPLTTETLHVAIMQMDLNGQSNDALTILQDSIEITYIHKGKEGIVSIIPEGIGVDRKIGLAIEPISTIRQPLLLSFKSAVIQVISLTSTIATTIGSLIVGLFTHNGASAGLMGPVGLAKEVGSAATIGFAYLLAFTAAISVNLAVLNIMPFPALDGGRLLVVLLEALFRRRFSAKMVGIIHTIGFALLLLLMVILTVGDIRKLL